MDYTPLLRRALRTIRYANVRFGILLSQSRLRGNDGRKNQGLQASVCRHAAIGALECLS